MRETRPELPPCESPGSAERAGQQQRINNFVHMRAVNVKTTWYLSRRGSALQTSDEKRNAEIYKFAQSSSRLSFSFGRTLDDYVDDRMARHCCISARYRSV
eukprot:scaffold318975_cov42-Prasinocladus_malaysianus.AAC.1